MERLKTAGKYVLNFLLILAIGALSLFLSVGSEGAGFVDALVSTDKRFLLIMAGLMLCYYLIDALILFIICKDLKYRITYKQSFVTNMTGVLFSDLTPSSTGGQFAQVYVFHNQGVPAGIGSGILAMCFVTYQIVIIIYATIAMLCNYQTIFSNRQTTVIAIVGFIVNVVITGGFFLATKLKKVHTFLTVSCLKFLEKIHLVKDYDKTSKTVNKSFEEFRNVSSILFSRKALFFKVCLCHVLKLTLLYSVPFFAALSLKVPLTAANYPNFLSLAAAISLFNTFMPIPGASGGSEASFMLLFGFLGQATASSAMLIWRSFTFYFGLLISVLVVAFAKDTKGGIMKGIKEMEKTQEDTPVLQPEDAVSDGDREQIRDKSEIDQQ
ncbi:MAG: flippase-like domain-containing protein [Saccharofermentans sp.]|nr:flippase-like domain-containing protein [Saccharofermentans sp.]